MRPSEGWKSLAEASSADPPSVGLGGLVVDETVSKIGRDFYDVFYSAWDPPAGVRSYSVRVQEQPSPGLGTRVVLLLDGEILGQLQLQPRYEVVEELAQRAAAVVSQELGRRRPAEMPAAAGSAAVEGGG